jgi:hypothetical protein
MTSSDRWAERRAMRDRFAQAIEEAFRETDSISLVAEGIIWAVWEAHITKQQLRARLLTGIVHKL